MDSENRTRVEEIMSTPLETVPPRTGVPEAATAMREMDINSLVVTTDPPGIVTSTDVIDVVANGRDPAELAVSDIMTESVETIPPSLYLQEAAAMMTTFGINHLPVVEGGDYLGMISSTDTSAELA